MSRHEYLKSGPDAVELVTLETPGLGNRSYLAIAPASDTPTVVSVAVTFPSRR